MVVDSLEGVCLNSVEGRMDSRRERERETDARLAITIHYFVGANWHNWLVFGTPCHPQRTLPTITKGANVVTLCLRRELRTFLIASSASFARGVARAGLNHGWGTLSRINTVSSVANPRADRARRSDPAGEICALSHFPSRSILFLPRYSSCCLSTRIADS